MANKNINKMGLIRKPSQLQVKPTLAVLIYGQPGIGKTTLACSAPEPVLFDCDGGVTRINGAHMVDTLQVERWEDIDAALKEIEGGQDYKTIIIDTCGKLLAFMEDYIKRTDPKLADRSGSLTLKGYGARKQMFINFINRVRLTGRSIVFVAHEQEQKRGDETVIRPEIGGSSVNDLIKELDLVGYMEAYGEGNDMYRAIAFNPSSKFYAKNTCSLPSPIQLPATVNPQGEATGKNDFLTKTIAAYFKKRKEDQERVSDYEDLMQCIEGKVECIENAETANEVVAEIMKMQHIFNSKEMASQLIAKQAKKVGIVYNKIKGAYEPAKD